MIVKNLEENTTTEPRVNSPDYHTIPVQNARKCPNTINRFHQKDFGTNRHLEEYCSIDPVAKRCRITVVILTKREVSESYSEERAQNNVSDVGEVNSQC